TSSEGLTAETECPCRISVPADSSCRSILLHGDLWRLRERDRRAFFQCRCRLRPTGDDADPTLRRRLGPWPIVLACIHNPGDVAQSDHCAQKFLPWSF